MKARPILMSAPMVNALLSGAKSQTRRIVKPQATGKTCLYDPAIGFRFHGGPNLKCPYGQPGDLLWVKETWAIKDCGNRVSLNPDAWASGWPVNRLQYCATDDPPQPDYWWNKRSSMFMPRWASRLTLELTDVRVERLKDISEANACAEGFASDGDESAKLWYAMLWDKINGNGAWEQNPWVWALTFKMHQQNVDAFLKVSTA
ncbi:MAG TPA: hypothetical protein VFE62_01390 [Gemmataceae bacterium]|nr:hypothetical protein [Gemmataceae bacterium]